MNSRKRAMRAGCCIDRLRNKLNIYARALLNVAKVGHLMLGKEYSQCLFYELFLLPNLSPAGSRAVRTFIETSHFEGIRRLKTRILNLQLRGTSNPPFSRARSSHCTNGYLNQTKPYSCLKNLFYTTAALLPSGGRVNSVPP